MIKFVIWGNKFKDSSVTCPLFKIIQRKDRRVFLLLFRTIYD